MAAIAEFSRVDPGAVDHQANGLHPPAHQLDRNADQLAQLGDKVAALGDSASGWPVGVHQFATKHP